MYHFDENVDIRSYCGKCCPGSRVPPHRPPHTDPGGEGVHLDTRYTGIPRDPSRKRRSCGRLRRKKKKEKKRTEPELSVKRLILNTSSL